MNFQNKDLSLISAINLISFFILFLFVIMYRTNLSFSSSFIIELSNNFNGTSIYTISSSCENSLVLNTWGGINHGCDCRDKNSTEKIKIEHENQIFIGDCSNNEKKIGCKNINSISKKDINSFKNIKFCINKENKNYKTFLENSVSKNENCKKGFKSCGYLDSLEQKLCVLENEKCPINDILINKDQELTNYITIPLKNNKYLHYGSGIEGKPIITSIKLSEKVAPCIYPGEYSWKYHYQLELSSGNCNTSILTSKIDDKFKKIDSINKYDLYEENNIFKLLNDVPNYPFNKIKEDNVDLYQRTYLGFDKKCMIENGFSFEYFDNFKNNYQIANICIKMIFYLFCLGLIILFIIILIIFILRFINKDFLKNVQILKKNKSCKIIGIIGIIKIILFILILISLIKLKSIEIKFICGDKYINELITEMSRAISCNVDISIGMIICSLIQIFSFFLFEFNDWKSIFDKNYDENKLISIKINEKEPIINNE